MAMFLQEFVPDFISKLTGFVEGELCKVLGVKHELKRLQRRLEVIKAVLEDAERRMFKSPVIGTWVRKLKDVMYDADDILDLCKIEGKKLSLSNSRSMSSLFSIMKFRRNLAKRIEKINERLDEIKEDRSIMPMLQESCPHEEETGENTRETTSLLVRSDIVGTQIEKGTQCLVESLVAEDGHKCEVFGITGMSGIGKSTLARRIYNDERIVENFPIRIWTFVSENFSERELLKVIIRSAGGDYGKAESKAELAPMLASILCRRFLIVLDDVWRANVWEDLLREVLLSASASGKVLVTTRNESIARNMGANVYRVNKMDDDDGWTLLCKNVFRDGEEVIHDLKEVGMKIVKKCDGLPLAIKAIAGLLRSKIRSKAEWDKVLQSDAWSMTELREELPRALYLSYSDLRPELKQCFLYCSLYPVAHGIARPDLIRVWVAEGFIRNRGNMLLEDIAEDYYFELLWRNLLQPDDGFFCRMHSSFHSLAQFLIGGEGISIWGGQMFDTNPITKIRRLSITNLGERVVIPEEIIAQGCLRTLLFYIHTPVEVPIDDIFRKLHWLRVLDLTGAPIDTLPSSLGNLVHLRHLDLDYTNIREIPESIGCLSNLQNLCLRGCEFLYTLPNSITRLCNLRCLRLEETPLQYLPKGIGKLKQLNHLEGFVVGSDGHGGLQHEGCDLEELQSLSEIRFLSINNLERALIGASAIANKTLLRELTLSSSMPMNAACGNPPYDEEAIQRIEQVHDELSPPSSLRYLCMEDFFGRGFPSWMMTSSLGFSFPELRMVKVPGCHSCPQLPMLGRLPQLHSVQFCRADAIVTIGPEFLGHPALEATSFPELRYLQLCHMFNWEEWSLGQWDQVAPDEHGRRAAPRLMPFLKLLRLELVACPKLRALPAGLWHASNLQTIAISGAHSLREIKNLPSFSGTLVLKHNQNLEAVSDLPALRHLIVEACPRLQYVENLNELRHLDLKLNQLEMPTDASSSMQQHAVECLPDWLRRLVDQHSSPPGNFQQFHLVCSQTVLLRCLEGSPDWPIIQQIPDVRVQNYDGTKVLCYTKNPYSYRTNASIDSQ